MKLAPIIQRFTQPATLGHAAHQFLSTLDAKLSDAPTAEEYQRALAETLGQRRFRDLAPGLRALAEAAWLDKGPKDIKLYLREQSDIALDTDVRDRWNRDVRRPLGPILETIVRQGKKELTTADTVQAFALEHGLPLLETTIRERYQPPVVEDRQAWREKLIAEIKTDLAKIPHWEVKVDLAKVDQLGTNLTNSFDTWLAMPAPEQEKFMDRLKTLAADLQNKPTETLMGMLKEASWKLSTVPAEANLATTVALSMVIAAKVGLAVTSIPAAIGVTLAVLSGWVVADFVGANFHHSRDNYPKGRTGKEFIDHHYDPVAVSHWPLRRNAEGLARGVVLPLAATAFLTGGPLAAFLITTLNGVLYTQHVHGYSHAKPTQIPTWVRALQKAKILLSPDEHRRHHSKPLGKEAYGVLNGWSNYITEPTEYFRLVEWVRQKLTSEEPTWKNEIAMREKAMESKKKGARATRYA